MEGWKKLPISLKELCIDTTLRCGQSFRWRKSTEDEWICVLRGCILILRQDATHLHYRSTRGQASLPSRPLATRDSSRDENNETLDLIRHYFNLKANLTQLYDHWAAADANFRKKAPKFTGIRILQQDAWEALVSFICSSNNNIARISQMVDKLCKHFGPLVGHVNTQAYHDFPQPAALVGSDVETKLRQLGFGYRAKYLWQTAKMVDKKGLDWLEGLRNPERPLLGAESREAGELMEGGRQGYKDAHEALLGLQGVGPKVADCVALMGLGWTEAVPVDTHVWQIAQRDYKFGKSRHSSMTKTTYDAVANHFRALWGIEAGWAQSVLFTANLRAFSERLKSETEVIKLKDEIIIKSESTHPEEMLLQNSKKNVKRVKSDLDVGEKCIISDTRYPATRRKKRRKNS